jgi:hypothetical protein
MGFERVWGFKGGEGKLLQKIFCTDENILV